MNDVDRSRVPVARHKFDAMAGPLNGDLEALGALDLKLALTFALKSDVARLRRSRSTTRPEYREQNNRRAQTGLFSPHPNQNTGAFRIGILKSTDPTRSSDNQLVQLPARLALPLSVCIDFG
jgi:hypothetical protein